MNQPHQPPPSHRGGAGPNGAGPRGPVPPGQPGRPGAAPRGPGAPGAPIAAPRPAGRPAAPVARPQSPPPQSPPPQSPRPQSPRPGSAGTPPRPYSPPPAARAAAAATVPPPVRPVAPQAAPEPLGPPPRPKKRKVGGWIALLVVAGGIGAAVWYVTHTAPASAGVGDCVAQTKSGSDSLVKIDCGDQGAQFRVTGRLEGKTQIDASLDACTAFPQATSAYWEGESGKPGLVLCLEPVTAPAAPKK